MNDEDWRAAVALTDCPYFRSLPEHILAHELDWRHWYESQDPTLYDLPGFQSGGSLEKSLWLRLVLVRTLRRDCTLACVRWFVRNVEWLGERYELPAHPGAALPVFPFPHPPRARVAGHALLPRLCANFLCVRVCMHAAGDSRRRRAGLWTCRHPPRRPCWPSRRQPHPPCFCCPREVTPLTLWSPLRGSAGKPWLVCPWGRARWVPAACARAPATPTPPPTDGRKGAHTPRPSRTSYALRPSGQELCRVLLPRLSA
jgi:hypothetical protein